MNPQRYEYVSEDLNDKGLPKSAKFWIGWQEGSTVFVRFGRIGTERIVKEKNLEDAEAAINHLEKKTQEKIKKGYKAV
ncbi:MAG: WGR domain-containing protein [Candidatus Thorarchaeota archaeon]|nr:WGR domain-containing protein [Candidatus Thorarchaeota archaeon]